jgi:hypothetical protein
LLPHLAIGTLKTCDYKKFKDKFLEHTFTEALCLAWLSQKIGQSEAT